MVKNLFYYNKRNLENLLRMAKENECLSFFLGLITARANFQCCYANSLFSCNGLLFVLDFIYEFLERFLIHNDFSNDSFGRKLSRRCSR